MSEKTLHFFINGAWSVPHSTISADVIDPATGQAFSKIRLADACDVDHAVAAARKAFDLVDVGTEHSGYAHVGDRIELLDKVVNAVRTRREDLAQMISREMGAPIDFARASQVDTAIGHIRAIADAARHAAFDAPITPDLTADRVRYEPAGVAALITPWNWPINQLALKVGAALAAGCSMVVKPSELAPLSAMIFAECLHEAGVPPGIFNLINGDGTGAGALLAEHPDVDVVSFTGSTRAGILVAKAAADRVARTSLELGGKSPNLLFADCDLPKAIQQGVAHCFRNAGQSCNAASRMLVERSIYDEAIALAKEATLQTCVDLPERAGSHLGPVVSETQFNRVQNYIENGVSEGARLVAGGVGRVSGLENGYFVRPTVFADVDANMTIAQEEIFGPVLVMSPFDGEAEAIRLANASVYGLAAYIQTGDPQRADRVAKRLKAGMIQINGVSRAPGAPFGGRKNSGVGREGGLWGIREFQEVKSISGAELF